MSIHTIPRPGTTYDKPFAELANAVQYGVGKRGLWAKLKETISWLRI